MYWRYVWGVVFSLKLGLIIGLLDHLADLLYGKCVLKYSLHCFSSNFHALHVCELQEKQGDAGTGHIQERPSIEPISASGRKEETISRIFSEIR